MNLCNHPRFRPLFIVKVETRLDCLLVMMLVWSAQLVSSPLLDNLHISPSCYCRHHNTHHQQYHCQSPSLTCFAFESLVLPYNFFLHREGADVVSQYPPFHLVFRNLI